MGYHSSASSNEFKGIEAIGVNIGDSYKETLTKCKKYITNSLYEGSEFYCEKQCGAFSLDLKKDGVEYGITGYSGTVCFISRTIKLEPGTSIKTIYERIKNKYGSPDKKNFSSSHDFDDRSEYSDFTQFDASYYFDAKLRFRAYGDVVYNPLGSNTFTTSIDACKLSTSTFYSCVSRCEKETSQKKARSVDIP